MSETTLPVEHLFTITAQTDRPSVVQGGPRGTKALIHVTGGSFEGPRLKGTVAGPSGDWVTVAPNGAMHLDVRMLLTTQDDVPILMTYLGVGVTTDEGLRIRTAPRFEVGDERYSWLNDIQAVATGTTGKGSVTYEVYALQ